MSHPMHLLVWVVLQNIYPIDHHSDIRVPRACLIALCLPDCASILTFLHTDFFWYGILSLKKPHPCPLVVSLFVFFLSLRLQYFFLSLNLNIWVPWGWWLDHHLLKPPKNTKGWLGHSKDCEIGQAIPRGCSCGKSHLEMHLEGLLAILKGH